MGLGFSNLLFQSHTWFHTRNKEGGEGGGVLITADFHLSRESVCKDLD